MLALENSVAPLSNPDLYGERTIDAIPLEAKLNFTGKKSNVTPPTKTRILALLNIFKKEIGITDLNLFHDSVMQDYKVLQSLARTTHGEMSQELKMTSSNSQYQPVWSEIPSSIKDRYCLILERKALSFGFPIHRCKKFWAADRLLFEVHKNRTNKRAAR
jgi:hypothetical protein